MEWLGMSYRTTYTTILHHACKVNTHKSPTSNSFIASYNIAPDSTDPILNTFSTTPEQKYKYLMF